MRLALLSILIFASPALAEPDAQLLGRLREGGYVLYLRHTSTDFSQNDSRMTSFEDCTTQRNLTDKGRAEARALGEHVKRLKIPIGEVLASPFCRTMETARLAFGKATATNEVRGGPGRTDDPTRYAPLPAHPISPKAKSPCCGPKAANGSECWPGCVSTTGRASNQAPHRKGGASRKQKDPVLFRGRAVRFEAQNLDSSSA